MPPVVEADDEDLATQRYFLDLLLQPLDEWEGFQRIEQFGLSAFRYELNFSQYALAMSQYTRTPAFTGYLAEAQRNAIVKMTARKVWSYWAVERLVGYGRWNPDPVVFHNIMYSAYFAMMIGLYETLNDDRQFSVPGSLSLRWDRRTTYRYDFKKIVEALRNNMLQKPKHPQYPCEPHLVYPACNTFAMNSMTMHDRLHGTEITGDLVDRVRTSYDRDGWRRRNGRFISIGTRAGRTLAGPMLFHDGAMAMLLNPTMPDVAAATWRALRSGGYVKVSGDGVELKRGVRSNGRGQLQPGSRRWPGQDGSDDGRPRAGGRRCRRCTGPLGHRTTRSRLVQRCTQAARAVTLELRQLRVGALGAARRHARPRQRRDPDAVAHRTAPRRRRVPRRARRQGGDRRRRSRPRAARR
ncbi:MAG: hypothetical protein R2698_14595 [Microthrixaceae bacterium]